MDSSRVAVVIACVRHGEVGNAVAVQVPYRDSSVVATVCHRGLEGAVAVAQEHDRAGCKVQLAVSVEVAHRHEDRIAVGGVTSSGLKSAVALAQQNTYRVSLRVVG